MNNEKQYEVTITETLKRRIVVSASSQEEAEYLVEDRWNSSEIILTPEDFSGVDFSAKQFRERTVYGEKYNF